MIIIKLSHYIQYFQKQSGYSKSCHAQNKWMYFLIEDDNLLEKYNTVYDKVSIDIKKEIDIELFYNIKFKAFHDKEIAKIDSNHSCLVDLLSIKIGNSIHKRF